MSHRGLKAVAAHYREYRAPAKDPYGEEMCAPSPAQVAASPGLSAHATTMRQAPKEQRQPLRGDQDENLKAYAIRKSDLMAASCESRGSFCGSSPRTHLENGHRTEPRLGQGRTKVEQYSENTSAANDSVERQPLHDLNGVLSRTPLGQAITGKGQGVENDGRNESTDSFRERKLRQMQAANEELVKRRAQHNTTAPEKQTRRDTAQPGAQGGSSTAALLRAAKAKQHKKHPAQDTSAPRSASVPKKAAGAEAKKLVYTLHSPSMEPDAAASSRQADVNNMQTQGHARPQSQPPPAVEDAAAFRGSGGEQGQARGRPVQRADDVHDGASVPSHTTKENVSRKVAAIARGFEARAGTSPAKGPDSGGVTPKRAAAIHQTPSPEVNYERYGMGGNSSGKAVWPPFLIAPERKASPRPGSSEPTPGQLEPEVDTASAGPRVIRALSFRGTPAEASAHSPADNQPAAVDALPRPHSTPPQAPTEPESGAAKPGPKERKHQADNDAHHVRSEVSEPRPATATVLSRPPATLPQAGASQPVKLAGLARAQVKAFGSPFKQKEVVVEQANDNVSMSMSCNVNMASPTGQAGATATSFEIQSNPVEDTPASTPQMATDPRKAAALDRKKRMAQAKEVAAAPSGSHCDPQDTDLRAATPPTAQNGGSMLLQRVSDAATSPVDSIWCLERSSAVQRPLKKALTPQTAARHDAIEQQTLLAPDGSPADPAFGELEMGAVRTGEAAATFSVSRTTSEPSSENSRRRTGSSSRDPELRNQFSGESSRLQLAGSRGALEVSAAHMQDSSALDEPFVDMLGVHVSSAYLKAGSVGGGVQAKCCGCAIM